MKKSKSVAIRNLGCKVNEYEADVLRQMLQDDGYEIVKFDDFADVYIVNTCSVTNMADKKSRQTLHRARKTNQNALVIAMGCYVQVNEEAAKVDDCIDILIGNNKKKEIIDIIEKALAEKDIKDKTLNNTTILDISTVKSYEEMKRDSTPERTRANVKIQDGCNQFCTFCIIPYARGRVRSRKISDIRSEVEGLVNNGFKEIVLTGIHISSYGVDLEEKISLIDVIKEIHCIDNLERIRIGSLEPRIITEEFVKELLKLDKVCPHFHLSLQSGSDEVLKRMRRRYTTAEYFQKVQLLRANYELPAITTDIIVGFPMETDEEFEETLQFVRDIKFTETHVFKYSKRHGTKASEMEGQINESQKHSRSEILIALTKEHASEYKERYIGKNVEVLYEDTKEINNDIFQVGHTKEYIKVARKQNITLENQIENGEICAKLTEEYMEIY